MSGTLPTQVKLLESIRDVPREAWNALVDEEAAPFLEWRWLEALESSGSVRGGHGLGAAPPHALARTPPGGGRAGLPQGRQHGEFVFDWSWATASERVGVPYYPKLVLAAPLTPATGRRVLVAPGEDRRRPHPGADAGAVELRPRAKRLSSLHVLFPTREEAEAPRGAGLRAFATGCSTTSTTRVTAASRTCSPASPASGETSSGESGGPPRSRGRVTDLARRGTGRGGPGEVYRLYASTVDKFAWGRRYLTEDFFTRVLERLPAPGGAGAGR